MQQRCTDERNNLFGKIPRFLGKHNFYSLSSPLFPWTRHEKFRINVPMHISDIELEICQSLESDVKNCAIFDKCSKLGQLQNFVFYLMNLDLFEFTITILGVVQYGKFCKKKSNQYWISFSKVKPWYYWLSCKKGNKKIWCVYWFFALGLFVAAVSRVEWMDLS